MWTDDLSHSCPHRHFAPNFTFAFVILKVINSEIILFRFAIIFCVNGISPDCHFMTNPGTTTITIWEVNSDHGLSFAGEFAFFYRFTVLLNSGGQILRGLSFGLSFLILSGWGWFPHSSILTAAIVLTLSFFAYNWSFFTYSGRMCL